MRYVIQYSYMQMHWPGTLPEEGTHQSHLRLTIYGVLRDEACTWTADNAHALTTLRVQGRMCTHIVSSLQALENECVHMNTNQPLKAALYALVYSIAKARLQYIRTPLSHVIQHYNNSTAIARRPQPRTY